MNEHIPADEICIHAVGTFLNIHISVDHLSGTWSTFDITNISHNLTVGLSEVHLAYVGHGSFNLLCKWSELKMKARKLLNHKLGLTTNKIIKDLQIKLIKLEYMSKWPHKLIVPQELMDKLEHYTGQASNDMPEEYNSDHYKPKNEELYNASTESYTDSDETEIYSSSDSTTLYDLDETIIGTIKLQNLKPNTAKTVTTLSSSGTLERRNQHTSQRMQKKARQTLYI